MDATGPRADDLTVCDLVDALPDGVVTPLVTLLDETGAIDADDLARLPALLAEHQPKLVIVSIGGNDFLRKLPESDTRTHVHAICKQALAAGAQVLLVGMRMPPNYGPEYTRGFEQNFSALSRQYGTALLPFLLEPIALDRNAYQADNLHPVAAAQPLLAEQVLKALDALPPRRTRRATALRGWR